MRFSSDVSRWGSAGGWIHFYLVPFVVVCWITPDSFSLFFKHLTSHFPSTLKIFFFSLWMLFYFYNYILLSKHFLTCAVSLCRGQLLWSIIWTSKASKFSNHMNLHCHSDSDFLKILKGYVTMLKINLFCVMQCVYVLKGSSDARFPQVDMIF